MRILHVIDSLGIYGAEAVLLNLARLQSARGDTPMILSLGGLAAGEKAIEAEARRGGIECASVRMRDGLNLALARRIVDVAREKQADVIHSHGYKSNILLGLLPRRARPVPVVTTLHGWTAKSAFSKLGLYRFLDQRMLPRLDRVVIVNEKLRECRALANLEPRAVMIANGIASRPADAGPEPELARRVSILRERCGVLLGVVGRLSPEKNVAGLIDALAGLGPKASQVGLVVIGAGPEQPAIESAIARGALADRVLLAGYVANARAALPLLDALVIPSFTEGLPMILLEAMAESVPVVATRVGEIPAVLGEQGVLVPPGDRDALAAAIATVTEDLPRFRAIAAQAATRIEHEYSARAMAEGYARVYESTMKVQS